MRWNAARFGPRELWEPGAKSVSVFDVHEGKPSWHQQRAGGVSAAVTSGFKTREDAEAYQKRLAEHHPETSSFVIERKVRA